MSDVGKCLVGSWKLYPDVFPPYGHMAAAGEDRAGYFKTKKRMSRGAIASSVERCITIT